MLFRRLHTSERYPGSELGLAICQKIVEQHGGHIWLEPSPPGATFHFILRAGAPDPEVPTPGSPNRETAA